MTIKSLSITLFFLALFAPIASGHIAQDSRSQREAAVARAVQWFHSQQQVGGDRDGAIGGHADTCDAVRVLSLAGEDTAGPAWTPGSTSLLQRCQLDVATHVARNDAGYLAKDLRAVLAAGQDPRNFGGYDLIARLEAQYDPDTGFYHPYNLFRNSLAIIALNEAGRPLPAAAIAAVIGDENPDGCWGWPIGGDITDTDTTGLALEGLAGAGYASHPAVSRCVSALRAHQLADAGWEARWGDGVSNSDSTALVIEGLTAAGWDAEGPAFTRNHRTAVQALLRFQAADGSFWWRQDVPGTQLYGTTHAIQPLLMRYPNEIAKPLQLFLPLAQRH